jgi:hypothetical protein
MRLGPTRIIAAVLFCVLCTSGFGASPSPSKPVFLPVNVPFTDEDPVMDGMATSRQEWDKAFRIPDSFFFGAAWRAGYYYFQSRMNWTAESVGSGSTLSYPGQTTFVAHDIIGSADEKNFLHQFRVDEETDWNSFEFPVPGGMATIWVFDAHDELDDSKWILSSEGLHLSSLIPEGQGENLLDDRGFIARLNDDPETDVHWLPGMPEPGDRAWVWEDWHWVFGRRTFGKSFQDQRIDTDPENNVDHEVYEFCAYNPKWTREGDPPPPPPWCIWWSSITVTTWRPAWMTVIKDGIARRVKVKVAQKKKVPILKGQFWLHFWPPEFPVGTPPIGEQINLVMLGLEGLYADASEKAAENLSKAIDAFSKACFTGLMGGCRVTLFREMKNFYKFLGKAKKAGIKPEDTIDTEMQALTLVGDTALGFMIELDMAGGTIENKNLLKASKGLYGFGKTLRKVGQKGLKSKPGAAVGKLKKVFKALDKASMEIPR